MRPLFVNVLDLEFHLQRQKYIDPGFIRNAAPVAIKEHKAAQRIRLHPGGIGQIEHIKIIILIPLLFLYVNQNGKVQWTLVFDGPAKDNDFAQDIAVDDAGNIYVTCASQSIETSYDYAVKV